MKTIATVGMLLLATTASAQEPWTMDECIGYALSHSHAVRASEVNAQVAKAEALGARLGFLPSVSTQSSVQWSWGRNVSPKTNTYVDVTTFHNGYGVYASMSLFDGGRTLGQWRQARAARRQSLSDAQVARDDKAFEVMQAYVDAVYMHGCVDLAEQELRESEEQLRKARVLEDVGLTGAPDVAQMLSRKANSEYNLTCQRNLLETSMMKLRRAMGIEEKGEEGQFRIATDAASLSTKDIAMGSVDERFASARHRLDLSRYGYRTARGGLMPSLSLQAGLSTSYYRTLTGSGDVPSFSNQLKNKLGEYIGVSLNIPLFSAGTLSSVKRAKLNYKRAQIDHEETMQQLRNDKQQAVMDCLALQGEIEKMHTKVAADSVA